MSVDISVTGTEKLVRLAAAIKASGDKDMQRGLTKAVRKSNRPMLRAARRGAIAILPYRGGLAERVASSRFTTRVSTTGAGAGVRVTGVSRQRDQLDRMDEQGIVRHPTYGHRPWNNQKITPGWFTKPLTLEAQKTGRDIEQAVDTVARELEAKGG